MFSLTGWSPRVPPRFHVSRRTLDTACLRPGFGYGAVTPSGWLSQSHSPALRNAFLRSEPRGAAHPGLGPSHFARRYSGNRCFFLFLRLLRCFSSPGSPPWPMDSAMDTQGSPAWVSPFRYLRIKAYLPLPAAFRSLSRLSSALSAKASALCSSSLNLSCFPCLA